jgi:hypothetical protein
MADANHLDTDAEVIRLLAAGRRSGAIRMQPGQEPPPPDQEDERDHFNRQVIAAAAKVAEPGQNDVLDGIVQTAKDELRLRATARAARRN